MALAVTLMITMVMTGLGIALSMLTMVETRIAISHRAGFEAAYAAEAAIEVSWREARDAPDLDLLLAEGATSTRVDGDPAGTRETAAGLIDLSAETNLLRCGHAAPCTSAELSAVTRERPWGANNPVWQPYAFGPLASVLEAGAVASDVYVVVWIASGPDADSLSLRAHAYGPGGVRRAAEVTATRSEPRHMASWRAGL